MGPARKISQRGVFLLPNTLTTGALFAGFYSILAGINGQFAAAAIAVVVAGLLDGLDGRVARLTRTQSDFGLQYDSLADLVSFGLAPALLAFNWSLRSLGELGTLPGKLGWLAAFIYMACAALRLARFNTQAEQLDKSHFQGLASPAAAGTLVVTVWFFVDRGVDGASVRWLILPLTVALGLLMFSRIRYYSFKTWPRREKVPIAWIFILALGLGFFAIDPPAMMMVSGFIYVIAGIVLTLLGRRDRQSRRANRQANRAGSSRDETRPGAGHEAGPGDDGP